MNKDRECNGLIKQASIKNITINILWTTILFIIITIGLTNHSVEAKSIQDYEKELQELEKKSSKLQSEKNEIQQNKNSLDNEKNKNLDSQSSVENEMDKIELELEDTQSDIDVKENEIAITTNTIKKLQAEIEKLNEEILDLQERIKKREELLVERLRAIQENGGNVSYVSVILGSDSFADFITRSSAVNSIMDQDKNIMDEHTADKKALEEKEAQVKEKKSSVEAEKAEQEKQKESLLSLKDKLKDQKAEKKKIKKELVAEFEELEEEGLSLEDEQALIDSQEKVLAEAKQDANSKKSDLEAEEKRKREEAARQKEANQNANSNSSSGSGSSSASSNSGSNTVGKGNGSLAWPVSSSRAVRSGFGPRIHPITGEVGKQHNGIDIAPPSPGQKVPVSAADSGIVTYAGVMSGYGNTVMIHHGNVTTLYAHLDSIGVSKGQNVGQGSQIGVMGTTGNSTGVHLHFEVHPGGYPNAVNPQNYF